jgi:hypothetical protein
MANNARFKVVLLSCLLFITAYWVHPAGAANGPENTHSQTIVSVGKGDIKGLLLAEGNGQPVTEQGLLLFRFYAADDKDDYGKPIGLNLLLKCDKCPKATTDKMGNFEFKGVPVGKYTIALGSEYDVSTMTDQSMLKRGGLMVVFTLEAGETANVGTIVVRK